MMMAILGAGLGIGGMAKDPAAPLIRSAASGRWSEPTTWEGGKVPGGGSRVQVRTGHVVTFDARTRAPIRSIHVAGTLRFDPRSDTRLDVGLIKIQAGDDPGESGFDCEGHAMPADASRARPALEVGTPGEPIGPNHSALIRLVPMPGLDPEECPAIVCCGGRWDVHGTPLARTWVKLGAGASRGATTLTLAEPVPDWRVGDRLIITATRRPAAREEAKAPGVRANPRTEERIIRAVEGSLVTIDTPMELAHFHSASPAAWRGSAATGPVRSSRRWRFRVTPTTTGWRSTRPRPSAMTGRTCMSP
jgi:hypothetical protein